MTREELIKSLTLLKDQARNSGVNTFVWDINIDGFNFVIDSAIKALKQQYVADINSAWECGYDVGRSEQEPKTGHWIKYGIPRCGEQHYKCTNCDEYFNFGVYSDYYKKAFKFCPNCGAKMVEPQESEDKE